MERQMANPFEKLIRRKSAAIATSRATWSEIAAIVILISAPTLSSLGCSFFWSGGYQQLAQQDRKAEQKSATVFETGLFQSMVLELRFVPVVLIVMWRSGKGWASFGLVKPKVGKDILIAVGLSLAAATFDALISLAAYRHPHASSYFYPVVVPWRRAILLLGNCCAVGFSEELQIRAYLIPRLEAVTGATWKAVLLSVILFGFLHFDNGYVGVIRGVASGMVWSVGFCLTRRIWPVALSHAITDFIIFTHTSSLLGS